MHSTSNTKGISKANSTSGVRAGLACAGGVIEGAIYEIGALCALEEAIEGINFNDLDVYVGVSSGALINACLANGIPPRTLSRAIISQAHPSLNIEPDVLFRPALSEYWERFQAAPGAVFKGIKKYLSSPLDLSPMGAMAEMSTLLPVGLFDNGPLEQYVARALSLDGRTNDFRELEAELRVVSVRLDTSETVVFGKKGTDHVPISKAVQASTALPVLYCPVEIDGQCYIDGVARRTLNASLALDAGADLLFCINPIVPVNTTVPGPLGRVHPSLVEYGLPSVLSQVFRSAIHSRRRTGFRDYAHRYPDADVILIEPDLEDLSLFFSNIFSFSNRHAVCEHAYSSTRRYLLEKQDLLRPTLEKHGLRLRTERLRDDSRTLFGRLRPASERPDGEHTFDRALDAMDRFDRTLEALNEGEDVRENEARANAGVTSRLETA